MTAIVIRGDARRLPLPDASVDLVVTSPPYYALRSYTDDGEHYAGQVGSEATPQEFLAALWECTAEWVRVLKPEGSIFVNLGDKYGRGSRTTNEPQNNVRTGSVPLRTAPTGNDKSLLGLPWRYALGAIDQLGLILRAEIIWAKPNGLPESVTDRVRRSHEQVFHFTRQPRYYAAVDEVREPQLHDIKRVWSANPTGDKWQGVAAETGSENRWNIGQRSLHPLGKLPGSVWNIPSQPLQVPPRLGVDHFAAFPAELPRRIIAGWSPPGVCTACGQGRRPVTVTQYSKPIPGNDLNGRRRNAGDATWSFHERREARATITGYACACTPYTDHPGTGHGQRGGERWSAGSTPGRPRQDQTGSLGNTERVGPWREYHFDRWTPPPTRPAIVLDPFMGTGTSLLAASVLGRIGVGVDLSMDYARLAQWRCNDPGERCRVIGAPKPPPVADGQDALFSLPEITAR